MTSGNGRQLAAVMAVAMVLVGAGGAQAHDEPDAPYWSRFDWTGFYLGLNGGFGIGNNSEVRLLVPGHGSGGPETVTTEGFIGGGTIGAQWQRRWLVLGLEADLDLANYRGTSAPVDVLVPVAQPAQARFDSRSSWLATLRGRLGYAQDIMLGYFTVGLAAADSEFTYHSNVSGLTQKASSTRTGWTIGGGVETAFSDHITAKVEFLHVDLGSADLNVPAAPGVTTTGTVRFDPRVEIARFGINYKF